MRQGHIPLLSPNHALPCFLNDGADAQRRTVPNFAHLPHVANTTLVIAERASQLWISSVRVRSLYLHNDAILLPAKGKGTRCLVQGYSSTERALQESDRKVRSMLGPDQSACIVHRQTRRDSSASSSSSNSSSGSGRQVVEVEVAGSGVVVDK